MNADDKEARARISGFVTGLKDLGWTDGRNVQIDIRLGAADATIRKHAAEIVALAPDVILAAGSAAAGPLLQITNTVPVVFGIVPDPVGAGFVASLAKWQCHGIPLVRIQHRRKVVGSTQRGHALAKFNIDERFPVPGGVLLLSKSGIECPGSVPVSPFQSGLEERQQCRVTGAMT